MKTVTKIRTSCNVRHKLIDVVKDIDLDEALFERVWVPLYDLYWIIDYSVSRNILKS